MIFLLMAKTSIKDYLLILDQIAYIYYLIWFKRNKVQALIVLGNKVNAITIYYISKLNLKFFCIDITA